jgi:hypothetical protein
VTRCDKCGEPSRLIAPVMNPGNSYVLDDITDMNRHLPRSALTDEQNAAIPWGTHPDDDEIQTWCIDCVRSLAA